ncbi:MAG: GerMN domain-containing protein, partial [Halanaerobiales bacterium]
DFSEELQNNFNYGTNIETKTIKAITETLLSINRVRGIKILINGQSNQTIGGHIVLKTIYRK